MYGIFNNEIKDSDKESEGIVLRDPQWHYGDPVLLIAATSEKYSPRMKGSTNSAEWPKVGATRNRLPYIIRKHTQRRAQ